MRPSRVTKDRRSAFFADFVGLNKSKSDALDLANESFLLIMKVKVLCMSMILCNFATRKGVLYTFVK